MISRDAALAAVRALAAAFPSPQLPEETVALYVDQLTQPPFVDTDTLMIVIGEVIGMFDRMPTVHQLLVGYQGAARAKIAEEQHQLERRGIARTSTPQPDSRYGREMIDVLRTALAENIQTGEGSRGHDHRQGAAGCSVCVRSEQTAADVRARVGELLKARHIVARPQPVVTYRCPDCQDRGVVEVDGPEGQLTVRPCPRCREEQYAAWGEGKYALRRGF